LGHGEDDRLRIGGLEGRVASTPPPELLSSNVADIDRDIDDADAPSRDPRPPFLSPSLLLAFLRR